MKIQEVADKTGLTIYTLRYYEEIGLIPPIARADGGHRQYTEQDVYWIIFVARLRETGMPIAQIQRYTMLALAGDSTAYARLQLLEEHRVAVEEEIARLCEHLKLIQGKIAHYRELNEKALQEGNAPTGESEPPLRENDGAPFRSPNSPRFRHVAREDDGKR